MVVKVDIQKVRSAMYWTNRYLLDVDDPGDVSLAMVTEIAEREQNFHASTVTIISARVSDMVEGTDNFYIYPLNLVGSQSDGGEPVAGFITLRVDFGVGPGRPCRKYYRTYVGEDKTTGGSWAATHVAAVQTVMTNMIALIPTLCDPQGNHWVNAAVKSNLQMRQLRRGTRKKLEPVIPLT